jgi:U3 small nucleolar RNA-associated protein MPP10
VSNVATTSMEDALPTTQSAATMLAPEEMLAPASASQLVSRTELDPEEKRRSRQKTRKARATQRKALDVAVDKFAGKSGVGGPSRARGGVRGEKDRALQELVKTGKGVTVVGQQPAKRKGTRPTSASAGPSVGLKL